MERTSTFIKVWFWSRNDPTVPADVKTAGATVNTDAWVSPKFRKLRRRACSGAMSRSRHIYSTVADYEALWQGTPEALFVNDQCDINAHFGPHNIVINLTFCECPALMVAGSIYLRSVCAPRRRRLGRPSPVLQHIGQLPGKLQR